MKGVLGSVKCRAEARRRVAPVASLLVAPNLVEARMPHERQPGFWERVTGESQRVWIVRVLPQKGTLGPRPRQVGGRTGKMGGI